MFDYEKSLDAVKVFMTEQQGVSYYTTYPANNCVGVSFGRVEAYCIMNADCTEVVNFVID